MRRHAPSALIMLLTLTLIGITTLVACSPDDSAPINVVSDDAVPEAVSLFTVNALQQANVPAADLVDLARRLRGVDDIAPPPATAPTRYVGDYAQFHVTNSDDGFSFEVEGRLVVSGEHIYMWVEGGASVSEEALQALALAWDEQIYQQTRELWGSEAIPGIDGDSRVHVLFTGNLGPRLAAHFLRRNTYPKSVSPDSNEREMFIVNLDTMADDIGGVYIQGIMAHEFQHMIRANIDANEATWLEEGFSTFTEVYLGYDSAAWIVDTFLRAEATQLNTFPRNSQQRLQHYGAGLLFVSYFYERYGLAGLQALSADPATGLISVNNALETLEQPDADTFFAEWVLANWIQDAAMGDGRYGYTLITLPFQPTVADTVQSYPYTAQAVAPQYGSHYYVFSNLSNLDALSFSLDLPASTPLIPTTAASGNRMWYSNRGDNTNTWLTRAFDLSEVETATLTYRAWYEIEENWDYAYAEISIDGGEHWQFLSTDNTTAENPFSAAYGPGYTGKSGEWVNESVSLDAYTGQEVLIRFEMVTDDSINLPGLAIDDVSIPEIDYAADFEADDGDWLPVGWVWVDNILPQQAWVQSIQYAGNQTSLTRWHISDEDRSFSWTLRLLENVDRVVLVISPFAPVTTVPAQYALTVSGDD
jgi:immune inhibitor A